MIDYVALARRALDVARQQREDGVLPHSPLLPQGYEREKASKEEEKSLTREESAEKAEKEKEVSSLYLSLPLDPRSVREVLGPKPDPHALAILRFDVLAAVRLLEREIQAGQIGQHPLMVRGLPLGLWLDLDALARWLVAGKDARA
jgi:hypothetical protein